jgi:hypothetical protein
MLWGTGNDLKSQISDESCKAPDLDLASNETATAPFVYFV